MKKQLQYMLIIMFLSIIFQSCQTYQLTNREEEVKTFAIDFREYVDKGFLFMTGEYYGEYEVKGIIRAELHPQVRYIDGVYPEGDGYRAHKFYLGKEITQITGVVDMGELIEHIYNLALEWGGDAFSHFETSIETDRTDDNPNTTYAYYTISGIVIKRK